MFHVEHKYIESEVGQVKRNTKNQNVQAENVLAIGLYYTFLRRIATDCWKFEGLPFDDKDVCQHANNILNDTFVRGLQSGLWKEGDFFVVGQIVGASPLTWYGGYTRYQCQTFVNSIQKDVSEVCTLSATISPYSNYDLVSIDGMCHHFASLLYECDRIISVNLKGQNTPAILNAPEGQEVTMANLYEQIAGHKPVVFTRDMSPLKSQYDDIRMLAYQTPAPFVGSNIEQLKSMLISDFMFMLGINNRTQNKSAQLTSPELMQDAPTLMVVRNSYQLARQNFCDQCKDKFGLDVTAEFNDSVVGDLGMLDKFEPFEESVEKPDNDGNVNENSENEESEVKEDDSDNKD